MPKKVFVSYNHQQGEWVWDRLVPCLRAGGLDVRIDRERFVAGKGVVGQMDATQDGADVSLLVLTPSYLASDYCCHEMERALAQDGALPVLREPCSLPDSIKDPNLLYVDLREDGLAEPWELLFRSLGMDLGTDAPKWLQARDRVRRWLQRGDSVNLVVKGQGVAWRPLLEDLRRDSGVPELVMVDLENPRTVSRRGLVEEILRACGSNLTVPPPPEDLPVLDRGLAGGRQRLALTHFDLAGARTDYGTDLFVALCYLMTQRRLVLLFQTRSSITSFLPGDHPLSRFDVKAVELQGRP